MAPKLIYWAELNFGPRIWAVSTDRKEAIQKVKEQCERELKDDEIEVSEYIRIKSV